MDPDLEERFVTRFVRKEQRAKLRRWLAEEHSRNRVREKLPQGFEAYLDPRFIVTDTAFERGRRPRYHIAANPGVDGRWLSEHDFRLENGGYYDSLIAIVDPDHAALYVTGDDRKRVYLSRE